MSRNTAQTCQRCDETPHRAHCTTCRRERRVTYGHLAPCQFAALDVFNVASTFPAYSVKTQTCILVRCARCGAVFRDTHINLFGPFKNPKDGESRRKSDGKTQKDAEKRNIY